MEYFVGIDLHKHFFVYHATDKDGNEIVKGRFDSLHSEVDKFLKLFKTPPSVVVEATGAWMWFVRILQEKGCKVVLAHPLKVKAIASAKIKTDSIDAKILCHLLRTNLIPESYIATHEEQENRELIRGRICLVHDRTQIKNRIIAILSKDNLRFSGTDTFGTKGRAWLKNQKLPDAKDYMVKVYLEKLDEMQETISKLDEVIVQKGSGIPEVTLLTSIPGIGTTTAFLLASEIGNVERFHSAKGFSSYFGLVPRLSQSSSHAYYGRITKLGNPYVRWALVQTAQRACRWDDESRSYVLRLTKRCGKKKAIVALSRKLATIVYCILREKREYIANYTKQPKVYPGVPTGKVATV